MDEETLQHENRDSITVKKNAKGEYAWDAKVYFNAADGIDEAIKYLKDADTRLRAEFL